MNEVFSNDAQNKSVVKKRSREYSVWSAMKQRCCNIKDKDYPHYGGRGIKVCERWNIFANFYADMGPCQKGKSLNRRNNDLGYFKENCEWTDRLTQMNNTRANHFIEFNGRRQTLAQWARERGLKQHTLINRLLIGWSIEQALTEGAVQARVLEFRGQTKTVPEWSLLLSIPKKTIWERLQKGWSIENSLKPVKQRLPIITAD